MSTKLNISRDADTVVTYRFPSTVDFTDYGALFRVYDDLGGSTLLSFTETANSNGSYIRPDQNVVLLFISRDDVAALAVAEDETQPRIYSFDAFVNVDDVQSKIHGGPFIVYPLGSQVRGAVDDISVSLEGTEHDVTVNFDGAAVLAISAQQTALAAAEQAETSATNAASALTQINDAITGFEAALDAKVENQIMQGVTTKAPAQDVVYAALAGKQNIDATLTALAGVSTSANKLIYATGPDAFTTTDLTAAGRALLDDADAAAQRVTLGLGNVDNTSDANKPVSTATQAALDLKAPLASPTFTGTVGGITKGMVGLGNVDNTSDANKPVSTATQTALDTKAETVLNYTAYRAYTGAAKLVYIHGAASYAHMPDGTQGLFYTDGSDTSSPDNGGTVLIDGLGRRGKRVGAENGHWRETWFGVRSSNSAAANNTAMAALIAAAPTDAVTLVELTPSQSSYNFSEMINVNKPILFVAEGQSAGFGNNNLTTGVKWALVDAPSGHSFVWFNNGGSAQVSKTGGICGVDINANRRTANVITLTDVSGGVVRRNLIQNAGAGACILVDDQYSSDSAVNVNTHIEDNRIVTFYSSSYGVLQRGYSVPGAGGLHRVHIKRNFIQMWDGWGICIDNGDGYRIEDNNVYMYGVGFGIMGRSWSRLRFDGTPAWDAVNKVYTAGTICDPAVVSDNAVLFGTASTNVKPDGWNEASSGRSLYPWVDSAFAGIFDQNLIGSFGDRRDREFWWPYRLAEGGVSHYVRAHPNGDGQNGLTGPGAPDVAQETITGQMYRRNGEMINGGATPRPSYLELKTTWRSTPTYRFGRQDADTANGYGNRVYSWGMTAAGAAVLLDRTDGQARLTIDQTTAKFYGESLELSLDTVLSSQATRFVWRASGTTRASFENNGDYLSLFPFNASGAFIGKSFGVHTPTGQVELPLTSGFSTASGQLLRVFNGLLYVDSSSETVKQDIEDVEIEHVLDFIQTAEAKFYRQRPEANAVGLPEHWSYYGYLAEQLHAAGHYRFVIYGFDDDDYDEIVVPGHPGSPEQVEIERVQNDAGEWVDEQITIPAVPPTPDTKTRVLKAGAVPTKPVSVDYARVVTFLQVGLKHALEKIDNIEARLSAIGA